MRVVDVMLAIPGILLAIGIVAWLDRGLPQIMFAVAIVNVPIFARILRGSLLSLRESDYVTASRALGAPGSRLLFRHMLPNSLTPLIVAATLALATAIIDVAGLGFLGLGPPDPRTPEWGTMLTESTKFLRQAVVAAHLPGRRHRHQRHRLQPARRRDARVARSEDAPMTLAQRPSRPSGPLLSVQDLVVRFRTHEGHHPRRQRRHVPARGGRTARPRRRVRLRQERHEPGPHPAPAQAGRPDRGRHRHVRRPGPDDLREDELRAIRGRDIAMIFQDPMTSLNPVLTVEEQMIETIQAHKRDVQGRRPRRARSSCSGMVGIPKPETRLKSFPHQFSGGMRQRVMIAMALALAPKLMIADEPTTALDVTIQAQVLELLRDLTDESRTALILITHDLGVVAGMTNRINVMYAGFIVETATTLDLFAEPSHPYTVGLLHSIPRLDAVEDEPLIPIEGRPPDMRHAPTGCPFAPRCRWRIETCWTDNPGLLPVVAGTPVVMTGEQRDAPDRLPQPADRRGARRRPPDATRVRGGAGPARRHRRGRCRAPRRTGRPSRRDRRGDPGRGRADLDGAVGRRAAAAARGRAHRRRRGLP